VKNIKYILYAFILVGFTSCFQEDDPVPPYQSPAGVNSSVAGMGPLYATQWFYDLGTDSFVKVTDRESWDLAFQCGDNDYHIYTNLSKFMSVANTGLTDFNAVTTGAGLNYDFDRSEGWEDSTAIGEWGTFNAGNVTSFNYVYVVDRGITTLGNNIGRKKMQVISLTGDTYQIRIADLNGNNEQVLNIPKYPNKNFTYISLTGTGSIADVEPDKFDYDIVFTQYTTLVEEIGTGVFHDYSTNGVLVNPYQVQTARDFTKPFLDIVYSDLSTYTWSTNWDYIGYEWKYYDFDLSTYVVLPNRTYIILSTEGDYYKLRFTSFVNDMGERGYPAFEVSKF